MNGVALFFAIIVGAPLGLGVAFTLFGSLLNRSNNHGDSVGESRIYTGGIIFSSQEDKKLYKTDAQNEYISLHAKSLPTDPVFKNPSARVARRMPQPENPAAPAAAYAATAAPAVAAAQAAPAGQGFPSSTAFPAAPAETPEPAAQVDPLAQGYSLPDPTMQGFSAPAAPQAPTAQDYENFDNYIE